MQQDAMKRPATAEGAQPSIVVRCLEAAIVLAAVAWATHIVMGYVAVGHDQSWYLYAARQMLHGTVLYGPHLEDVNPPLIYWINVVPAFGAQVLAISISLSFFLFVVALAVGSAVWCYRLLRDTELGATRLHRLAFAAAIFFAELNVQRATDVGQREQLVVIFILPYLVAFGLPRTRALGRIQIAALGVTAAIGFCVKPQQVLMLIAVQLAMYALSRDARRLTSPQTVTLAVMAVVMAAYVAAIVLFWPQYPHRIMPDIRDAYWAYAQTPIYKILLQKKFLAFVALAGVALWRRWLPLSTMPVILLAACVGGHAAYAAQRSVWYYHQIPRDAFLALFGLWCLLELAFSVARRDTEASLLPRSVGLLASAAVFYLLYLGLTRTGNILTPIPQTTDTETAATSFFDALPAHTPVYVFADDLIPAFPPVLNQNLIWASRAPHLLALPAIARNEWARDGGPAPGKALAPARLEEMSAQLRADVTADLRYWRPPYVLVSVCDQGMVCQALAAPGFDMVRWFERSPDFAAMWSNYRYQRSIIDTKRNSRWDVYRLESAPPK